MLQFTVAIALVFCCNVKPVEGDGQEIATVFVVVRATVSDGRAAEKRSGKDNGGIRFALPPYDWVWANTALFMVRGLMIASI